MIKSRRIRLAWNIARMREYRDIYKDFGAKTIRKE
jgi:hypothetical protein